MDTDSSSDLFAAAAVDDACAGVASTADQIN